MLSKKKAVIYLHKRWSRIIKHLYAFSENKDLEDLHQLRVEIKKTKALLNLLGNCSKNADFSGDLVAIKRIFRCAGKIRNAQINATLINRYKPINKEFINEQHKIIADKSKTLDLETNMYAKIHMSLYHDILEKVHGIKNECILRLYKKCIKKLSHSFADPNNNPFKLHESRKRIKRLIYMYALVNNRLKRKLRINILYLRELETMIGKWHDSVVAFELFSESPINKQLSLKPKRQVKKMLNAIITMTEDFSNKVHAPY